MPHQSILFTPLNSDYTLFNEQSGIRKQRYQNERYFSVVDIVGILSGSVDGRKYRNKLKQRLKEEGNEMVTNCHQLDNLTEKQKEKRKKKK